MKKEKSIGLKINLFVALVITVFVINYSAFAACDNLSDIYYTGQNSKWQEIKVGSGNTVINNAPKHYSDKEASANTDNIAEGICGPNTTWELKNDGTLNIAGQSFH